MLSTIYSRHKGFHLPLNPIFRDYETQFTSGSDGISTPAHGRRSREIVTCGFEDVLLPSERRDDEENEGRHHDHDHHHHHLMDRLFKFKHQSFLSMGRTLSKQLRVREGGIIFEYYDVTIYRSDLDNLRDGQWLNDNNISFVYEYLQHTVIDETLNKELVGGVDFFEDSIQLIKPAMVCLMASYSDPLDIQSVLPPLNNAKFIFLPINDSDGMLSGAAGGPGGSHWSLVVVAVNDGKLLYYDTSIDGSGQGGNLPQARHVGNQLARLLGVKLDFIIMECPQQTNNDDCGMLLCEITALLLRRLVSSVEEEEKVIDLRLDGVTLLANAGRSYITATILQLISIHKERIG